VKIGVHLREGDRATTTVALLCAASSSHVTYTMKAKGLGRGPRIKTSREWLRVAGF